MTVTQVQRRDSATILVVDDDQLVRDLVTSLLRAEGYSVIEAENGERAIAQMAVVSPDLVLLDVMMPGRVNGVQLCRQLKSNEATMLIPVVILTALDTLSDRLQGIEAGADDFLTKPFNRLELLARVRSLLRVKGLTDRLERAESVIFALAEAVEAKDPYTEGHLSRLANHAEALARELGLGTQIQKDVREGAILHDVGKIGVPEAILRKPAPLSSEEWRVMRNHPIVGHRILSPLRLGSRTRPAVRGHHEHFDGGGYPDGLAGQAIPIEARIVAVVDSFDAMTSDRPYKRAMSWKAAIEELRAESGRQFDPEVVQCFIELFLADGLSRMTLELPSLSSAEGDHA
jgi:putative two-component system response regulator